MFAGLWRFLQGAQNPADIVSASFAFQQPLGNTSLGLALTIWTAPNGALLLDATAKAERLQFSTHEHGFGVMSFFYPTNLGETFTLYAQKGRPYVEINWYGQSIYEGRVEDVKPVGDGFELTGYGFWNALSDIKYTSFWSLTQTDQFRPMVNTEYSTFNDKNYDLDTDQRLMISLNKSACFLHNADAGGLLYEAPSETLDRIKYVSACYTYDLPTNWRVQLGGANSIVASFVSSDITTTGGAASGIYSWNLSASPRTRLLFQVFNSSGASSLNTAESGSKFAVFTNIRLTSTASPIYANMVASALVTHVSACNPTQLDTTSVLIESPGVDLPDAVYQDQLPADILVDLAEQGDSSGSRVWEVGVWHGRRLYFRPRGTDGRGWLVDADDLEPQSSIANMYNAVYGIYQDAAGRTVRTTTQIDEFSRDEYGVVRQTAVEINTAASARVALYRSAFLNDHKNAIPRVVLKVRDLFDESGGRWPAFMVKSGDRITLRNLPVLGNQNIDRLRSFLVKETTYDAESDMVTIIPESPPPTLAVLTARASR